MLGLFAFTALFAGALWYFQVYAYYETVTGLTSLAVQDREIAIHDYAGIDASTSGLKRRGCFIADPGAFTGLEPAARPTPLKAPHWFDCFDHVALTEDLASGRALAYLAAANEFDGIDRMIAVYPDGRGYEWRQLNEKYAK
jgi:hypothetical protein